MKAARFGAALAVMAALAVPAGVSAQTERGNQLAYTAAIRCFVANGAASGEREDAGDAKEAARYERAARRSFDTAVKLGGVLGYSGSRINQDLGLAQAKELPKLVADPAYNRQTMATCRALGLL